MDFKQGDRVELILRSKKRVGTVEEVYNDTQKCKVQIDEFPVTVTKPQKYLVKVEGAELVVPQCVADWLNHCKQEGYNLFWSKKEPLYYVKLIDQATGYLNVRNDGRRSMSNSVQNEIFKTKFTESEIKEMDKGEVYWLLNEPVEEVEGEA
ncbi:DUF1642 domain-containing protein [Listeria monocytogenes]|uniref:DUF1642 domain-containing protein n=1 Tax=Listeria monocytogenes TaxID=1639 RepID=UPI0004D93BB3|nr:DUF1642 domain-containing protein [Listeria monocytogenes]KES97080.1 hypothetical protein HR75_00365 [Listeria monocytogenes]KET67336.1 hypothetical protein HS06_14910 [Listeria monocytogenes]KET94735.1 hypothetical protein HS18_00190 [Listeria monocytogenes]KEU61503.1 hypothetical protein HS35_14945 [Listeria monocytogenes]KEV70553.1 hypothetical protein HS58_04120 [Listeria monocytogenes]